MKYDVALYLEAMNRPKTRLATLYRLIPTVHDSHEIMFDAYTKYVALRELDERRADVEFIDVNGASSIWIGIQDDEEPSEWLADAAVTTQCHVDEPVHGLAEAPAAGYGA